MLNFRLEYSQSTSSQVLIDFVGLVQLALQVEPTEQIESLVILLPAEGTVIINLVISHKYIAVAVVACFYELPSHKIKFSTVIFTHTIFKFYPL